MVSHAITIHQKALLMENVKDFTESWAPVVIMDSALGNPSSQPKLKKNIKGVQLMSIKLIIFH